MAKEKISRYNLVTGQDDYASQTAQNPATARRLQSLIPSIAGDLVRELQNPLLASTVGNGPMLALFHFPWNEGNGAVHHYLLGVAQDNSIGGLGLWMYDGTGNFGRVLLQDVNRNGCIPPLHFFVDIPQFSIVNNVVHICDGTRTFLFDPADATSHTTLSGLPIPSDGWTPGIDTAIAGAGTLNVTTNRYYWTTNADHTVNHVHESDSSPISAGTGALVNQKVRVYQQKGTVTIAASDNVVHGAGTGFTADMVGMAFVSTNDIGLSGGMLITAVDPALQLITLDTHAGFFGATTAKHFLIVPIRCTHWHIYASESENSKVGFLLTEVPIFDPGSGAANLWYDDESPFQSDPATLFTSINRPFRNDLPPGSKIVETHKYRLFRRRETKPNFINFSANEEVLAGANGSPYESVPGADPNTLSDIVNETSVPDQSNRVRSLCSHGDALWIGTEKNHIPLFGETIDDFAFSQISAFSVGSAGRWAEKSTPHGLMFVSYDRKAYLYPTSMMPFAYVPKDVNVTENLVEIGRSIRKRLEAIKASDIDNVRVEFYNYGRRNWGVLAFQDNDSVYHTWVYDFETKGWFELQRGYTSLAIWEPSEGKKVLVGGFTDGNVYVIDDLTGTYNQQDPAVDYPAAIYRPALIDFGDPDTNHIPQYIEYELTNPDLNDDITINFYLDPVDVDNPGTPTPIVMAPVQIGANKFRGFFQRDGGNVCNRLLLEFSVAASKNSGAIRGLKLVGNRAQALLS